MANAVGRERALGERHVTEVIPIPWDPHPWRASSPVGQLVRCVSRVATSAARGFLVHKEIHCRVMRVRGTKEGAIHEQETCESHLHRALCGVLHAYHDHRGSSEQPMVLLALVEEQHWGIER